MGPAGRHGEQFVGGTRGSDPLTLHLDHRRTLDLLARVDDERIGPAYRHALGHASPQAEHYLRVVPEGGRNRVRIVFGFRGYIRRDDPRAADAEAETLFDRVVEEYGDVSCPKVPPRPGRSPTPPAEYMYIR